MRFWDPLSNPDQRLSRQRSVMRGVPNPGQFGQRPMFSRADEDNGPVSMLDQIAPEARLDDLVPADEGPGSKARAELIGVAASDPVFITYSSANVSATITEAEIMAVFGPRNSGFIGAIIDGTGAGKMWLCIKFRTYWHFVGMTRAT